MNRTSVKPKPRSTTADPAARWIDPAASLDRIRQCVSCPTGWGIQSLSVHRVFPAKPIGFGVQYQIVVHHLGKGTVHGSVYLSPLAKPIRLSRSTLRIQPRGVFTMTGLSVPVDDGRMLLHTADRDPHLPDLGIATSAVKMSRRLKLAYRPQCKCLSYRPGKRCTLAYVDARESGRFVVGKVFNNGLFDASPALHRRVRSALRNAATESFEIPRVVRALADLRMVVFQGVPVMNGRGRDDLATAAGRVLAGLHRIRNATNKPFGVADETKAVERWINLTARLRRMDARTDRLHTWLKRVGARLPAGPGVLLHRDFYDAQLIATRRGWALVDLDTAGIGDRELDVANYVAHQIWNGIRSRASCAASHDMAAFLRSYLSQQHRGAATLDGHRLRFYLVSSLVRVSLIHSLRTGERLAARSLMRVAERWARCPVPQCLPRLTNDGKA